MLEIAALMMAYRRLIEEQRMLVQQLLWLLAVRTKTLLWVAQLELRTIVQ